jgi:gp16 family phage-associated protein
MTPQQRKQQFINRGESVRAWAEDNGFDPKKDLAAVYRVLNGQSPARRGKHHEIAVKLGIKPNPEKLAA